MTLHWLYDVVWMALPLFVTQLAGAQALVLLVSAGPAIYVMWALATAGGLQKLSPKLLNQALPPPPLSPLPAIAIAIGQAAITRAARCTEPPGPP